MELREREPRLFQNRKLFAKKRFNSHCAIAFIAASNAMNESTDGCVGGGPKQVLLSLSLSLVVSIKVNPALVTYRR